jgi:hypothetical protein
MRVRTALVPVLFALATFVAQPAAAVEVFLNGVKITGQKDLSLNEVDVQLDAEGNVIITSDRYKVSGTGEEKAAAADKLTKTYWLVSTERSPGEAHYNVEVLVNDRWVATYKSGGNQLIQDITEFLVPGQNIVVVRARKEAGFGANPKSDGEITILLGEGASEEGRFVMKRTHIKVQRRAGESDNFDEEFKLYAE